MVSYIIISRVTCCDVRKEFKSNHLTFLLILHILYELRGLECFPTRQAGRGVHPLQQLSDTQLSTVVGMAWQHDLTHLDLSRVSVPFLTLLSEQRVLHGISMIPL